MKTMVVQFLAQNLHSNRPDRLDRRVRFPVTIRHRASKAKIYAPAGNFAYYRVAYATAGKRKMQTFAAYSDAKTAAERIVRDLIWRCSRPRGGLSRCPLPPVAR
jgi:hypothetical protein